MLLHVSYKISVSQPFNKSSHLLFLRDCDSFQVTIYVTLVISHIIYLFFRKFLNFHSWKWIFSHRTNNSYFFSKKRHLVWFLTLAVYFRCKYWRSPTRNVRKNLVKGYFIKQLLMPWPRCSNIQQYLSNM